MDFILKILREVFVLGENIFGVLVAPYRTYFKISSYRTIYQGLLILILVPFYGFLSSIIRVGLFRADLFELFVNFVKTTSSILLTFVLGVSSFVGVGKIMKKKFSKRTVVNLWAFAYVPTYFWFMVTAVLFYLLPPPREFTSLGLLFSAVFISFSTFLLLWKTLLYYLTLRIGLGLNFYEIVGASAVLFPLFGVFSLASYKFGIFRVPFV